MAAGTAPPRGEEAFARKRHQQAPRSWTGRCSRRAHAGPEPPAGPACGPSPSLGEAASNCRGTGAGRHETPCRRPPSRSSTWWRGRAADVLAVGGTDGTDVVPGLGRLRAGCPPGTDGLFCSRRQV